MELHQILGQQRWHSDWSLRYDGYTAINRGMHSFFTYSNRLILYYYLWCWFHVLRVISRKTLKKLWKRLDTADVIAFYLRTPNKFAVDLYDDPSFYVLNLRCSFFNGLVASCTDIWWWSERFETFFVSVSFKYRDFVVVSLLIHWYSSIWCFTNLIVKKVEQCPYTMKESVSYIIKNL